MKIHASAMRATSRAQSWADGAVRVLTTAPSSVRGETRRDPTIAVTMTPTPPPAQLGAVEDDRFLDCRPPPSRPTAVTFGDSTEERPRGASGGTAPPAGLRAPRGVAGALWAAPVPG